MRAKKPAKVKQPPLDSTLIGYTGRKPIYIANDAKHVLYAVQLGAENGCTLQLHKECC